MAGDSSQVSPLKTQIETLDEILVVLEESLIAHRYEPWALRLRLDRSVRSDAPRLGCIVKQLANYVFVLQAELLKDGVTFTKGNLLVGLTAVLGACQIVWRTYPAPTYRPDDDRIFYEFCGISRTYLGSGTDSVGHGIEKTVETL